LCRFDGWGKEFDCWKPMDSTEMFPMGYCHLVGLEIDPPFNNGKDDEEEEEEEEEKVVVEKSKAKKNTNQSKPVPDFKTPLPLKSALTFRPDGPSSSPSASKPKGKSRRKSTPRKIEIETTPAVISSIQSPQPVKKPPAPSRRRRPSTSKTPRTRTTKKSQNTKTPSNPTPKSSDGPDGPVVDLDSDLDGPEESVLSTKTNTTNTRKSGRVSKQPKFFGENIALLRPDLKL